MGWTVVGPVSPRQVRQAVAARVLGAFPGLRLSLAGYPGLREPTRSPVPMEYAVGVPSSEYVGERQRTTVPVLVRTDLRVAFCYQMANHLEDEGFDAALDIETAIRNHLMVVDADWPVGFQLTVQRSQRDAGPPSWLIFEQTFAALHYCDLSSTP